MSFDNARLKEEVDKVFAPANEPKGSTLSVAFMSENMQAIEGGSLAYRETSFSKNLSKAHNSLLEEEYDKVADAVAKDERIKQYLPYIALDAMEGLPGTSLAVQTNSYIDKNGFGISKTELEEAAQDTKHFDPVYRKGLAFAAENFDKFRSFNPNDGFPTTWIGGDSNYRNISENDLIRADRRLTKYAGLPMEIAANIRILGNFDAIDAENGSGKITYTEGKRWLDKNPAAKELELQAISSALPQANGERQLSDAEALSKIDYETRIAGLIKEQKDIAKLWGWDQTRPLPGV
jgi:hypothetical protein